jgi:hypothetical protein
MNKRSILAVGFMGLSAVAAASASSPASPKACDRQAIMQIDSGRVSVEPDGIAIDAFGTAESAGWSNPTLVIANRSGTTATVDFVACRPEMAAQVLTPIQTNALLDLPPDTTRIVIRARTNSMTVDINAQ